MRRTRLLTALVLTVLGVVLTTAVGVGPTPLAGEDAITRQVQGLPGWMTPMAEGIRAVTGTEMVALATAAIAGVLVLARRPWPATCLVAAFAVLVAAQGGIKDLLDRPRPSDQHVEVRDTWTSPSFPSGHVMGGTFFFVVLASAVPDRAPRRVRGAAILAAAGASAAGAVANIVMGVHWPTDAVAGLLFGSAAAMAAADVASHPPALKPGRMSRLRGRAR